MNKKNLVNIVKIILLGFATYLLVRQFLFLTNDPFSFNIICFFVNTTLVYIIEFFVTEKETNKKTYMMVFGICAISLIVILVSMIKQGYSYYEPYESDVYCGTPPTTEKDILFLIIIHCFIALKMIIINKCMKINAIVNRACKYLINMIILSAIVFFIIAYDQLCFDILFIFFIFLLISMIQFFVINLIEFLKVKLKIY